MITSRSMSHAAVLCLSVSLFLAVFLAVPHQVRAGNNVVNIRNPRPSDWEHDRWSESSSGGTPDWMVNYGNDMMNSAMGLAGGPGGAQTVAYEFQAFEAEYVMGPNGEWQLVQRHDYGGQGNLGGTPARTDRGATGNTTPGGNPGTSSRPGRPASPGTSGPGGGSSPGGTSRPATGYGGTPFEVAAVPGSNIPGYELPPGVDPDDPEAVNEEELADGSTSDIEMSYIKFHIEELGVGESRTVTSADGTLQKYDVREDTRLKFTLLPEFVPDCVPESVTVKITEYEVPRDLEPENPAHFEDGLIFRIPTDGYDQCCIEVTADSSDPGKTIVPLKLEIKVFDISMKQEVLLENTGGE